MDEVVLQWKVWVGIVEEPVFASYVDNQVNGGLTIGGVTAMHNTLVFEGTSLTCTSYMLIWTALTSIGQLWALRLRCHWF